MNVVWRGYPTSGQRRKRVVGYGTAENASLVSLVFLRGFSKRVYHVIHLLHAGRSEWGCR